MKNKIHFIGVLMLLLFMLLASNVHESAAEDSDPNQQKERSSLSVILYNWIPNLDEYFKTMEGEFESLHPEIDLKIISLPGYYDGLDTTYADVYEVDESGLRMLLAADRLQPIAYNEVKDPDDFFPICKDVAVIDGQWWGVPHWTCTNFMFYHKDDTELAKVKTFSELEKVIGGKDHPAGQGLLIDMMGIYRCRELYKDTLMDLYAEDPETIYTYMDENNIDERAIKIETRIINMMDPGMGRNSQNDKIFDYLQRQFMYGNGRAFVYYSEAIGYFYKIIEDAQSYGDTTISIDDIAVKAFVQSDTGKACQPGYVDSFCLDKGLRGQKRENALKYITWVTSRETVVNQLAPTEDFVRYLSPARLSIYTDPDLMEIAPLYEQLLPIMKIARYFPPPEDWDWAPGLEAKLEGNLPKN